MNPTNNIPKEYQTPQLMNYVGGLTPAQQNSVPTNQAILQQQPIQTPVVSQPTAPISASSMQPTQALKIPNLTPQSSGAEAIIAGTAQGAIDYNLAQQNAEKLQGAAGDQASIERKRLNDLAESVYGAKSAVQQNQVELERQLGIEMEQKALSEINTNIANENVAYRAEQDRIRNTPMSQAQAQVELGNLSDTYGRRLADLAIRQSAAQGNITSIQSNADRQTKLLLAPLDNKIKFLETFGKENVDALEKKDQQKLQLMVQDIESQKANIKDLQKTKTDFLTEVAKNGGGTDVQLIAAIQNARTPEEAASIAANSGYIGREDRLNSAFDRNIKQQQLNLAQAEFALKRAASTGSPKLISEQANKLVSTGDPTSNKVAIAALLSGDAVSAGTKGRLAPANEVMNAVEEFAANRQTGEFAGLGIGGRIKEGFKSLVNAESEESKLNSQALAALDLKVQQWASGASLSDPQTKQVQKLVPQKTDSDSTIRTKLSGLYNYMANNVESGLLTDGINVNFKPVNLFETRELIDKASPEQLQQLKDLGLIQ